jgi:catechol O-methyltransferase
MLLLCAVLFGALLPQTTCKISRDDYDDADSFGEVGEEWGQDYGGVGEDGYDEDGFAGNQGEGERDERDEGYEGDEGDEGYDEGYDEGDDEGDEGGEDEGGEEGGKEVAFVEFVESHATHGDAESVVKAADRFCWEVDWMMSIGDEKGKILDLAMRATAPRNVLEIGTYVGYSATRLARLLPKGGKLTTVDFDPRTAAVAARVFRAAGLSGAVEQLTMPADEAVAFLAARRAERDPGFQTYDLVLLDHVKDMYVHTLRQLERAGLLAVGGVVMADNVVNHRIVDYLDYVRSSGLYSTSELYLSEFEYDHEHRRDGIELSRYGGGALPECGGELRSCGKCLSSLCAWCAEEGRCVPDVQPDPDRMEIPEAYTGARCGGGGAMVGRFGTTMQCPAGGEGEGGGGECGSAAGAELDCRGCLARGCSWCKGGGGGGGGGGCMAAGACREGGGQTMLKCSIRKSVVAQIIPPNPAPPRSRAAADEL